jgi:sulfite reductase beta subunit-like hemoprotein
MSTSHPTLPPAFVPTSTDSAEMFSHRGRMMTVTYFPRSGDLTLCAGAAGCYSSLTLTRAEAQALATELQRVLASLPREAAA